VLQAIYELAEDRPPDIYIGQQMDVYLEAAAASTGVAHDLEGKDALKKDEG